MSEINTPRTDEAAYDVNDVGDVVPRKTGEHVCSELARELEFELNQWKDIANRLAENGGGLKRYSATQYLAALEDYKTLKGTHDHWRCDFRVKCNRCGAYGYNWDGFCHKYIAQTGTFCGGQYL